MPATDDNGTPSYVQEGAGALLELDFDHAVILVPSFVIGAVTPTTLQKPFAGWTVDQFMGAFVWISDGPGLNQRREILSNTVDTLTLTQPWTSNPTPAVSMAEIIQPTTIVSPDGVITEMPALGTNTGYLVRLNAQGVPYIDLLKPLVARYAIGIDMPPMEYPIGGAVRFKDGGLTGAGEADFEFRRYGQRWTLGVSGYGGYIQGGKLFLIGEQQIWSGVESIDVRYLPIIPAFTRLTDFVFLGDRAYDALVTRAAAFMGGRVNGLADVPKINVGELAAEATVAETVFLDGLGRMDRTVPQFVQEVLSARSPASSTAFRRSPTQPRGMNAFRSPSSTRRCTTSRAM